MMSTRFNFARLIVLLYLFQFVSSSGNPSEADLFYEISRFHLCLEILSRSRVVQTEIMVFHVCLSPYISPGPRIARSISESSGPLYTFSRVLSLILDDSSCVSVKR